MRTEEDSAGLSLDAGADRAAPVWPGRAQALAWVIIAGGFILRLVRYLADRSIWNDEASVAYGLRLFSYKELLTPMDKWREVPFPPGPVALFWVEKWLMQTFGENGLSMRFAPFVMGVLTLPLAYLVIRRCLQPLPGLVALCLIATFEALVFYSVELKPYSSDVTLGLLFTWAVIRMFQDGPSTSGLVWIWLCGVVGVWFSLSVVMVFAGVGLVLLAWVLMQRDWKTLGLLSLVGLCSIGSFGVLYTLAVKKYVDMGRQFQWIRDWTYWPFPPRSLSDLVWPLRSFVWFFTDPVGMIMPGLGMLLALIGAYTWFKRDRWVFAVLVAPALVILFASIPQKYPFGTSPRFEFPLFGRATLHALPAVAMIIGCGTAVLCERVSAHRRVATALILLVLLGPHLALAARNMARPPGLQELRPVLDYVQEHHQEGDVLYVNWGAKRQWIYYEDLYDLDGMRVIQGINYSRRGWEGYEREVEELRGNKRVWVICSYVYDWKRIDDESLFVFLLNRVGKPLDTVKFFNASGYLYDLSGEPDGP